MAKTFFCFSWCQNQHGIPLGLLTEGSIEVYNKDVKHANRYFFYILHRNSGLVWISRCFVARISSERVQRDILLRRTWESDPLLHYESTVLQARKQTVSACSQVPNWSRSGPMSKKSPEKVPILPESPFFPYCNIIQHKVPMATFWKASTEL